MSGASERANGRASGPVLQSVFLAVIDHSVMVFVFFVFLGVVNEIISGNAHMGLSPLTITNTRKKVIDFTDPFM